MDIVMQHYADYLGPGEWFHFTRTVLDSRRPRHLHRQDFHELLWIQNGRARHQVNGARQTLAEGDLQIIRPADVHAISAHDPDTWAVTILLHPDIVAAVGRRHPEAARRFLTPETALPAVHRHDMRQLADLSRAALRLETAPRTALRIEAFLLNLLSDLADRGPDLDARAPDWLAEACRAAQAIEVFSRGAQGFAAAAGRDPAHVSRVCREFLGITPTEYVNRIRMDHAARLLSGGTDPMASIARDCGITNLSHFHRLFKARHGMTPKAWRSHHQARIVQPI